MKKKTITTDIYVTVEDFFEFLKQHDVLDKFILNRLDKDHSSLNEEFFETNRPESWLSSAFIWAGTPELHTFWEKLHDLWAAELCLRSWEEDDVKLHYDGVRNS